MIKNLITRSFNTTVLKQRNKSGVEKRSHKLNFNIPHLFKTSQDIVESTSYIHNI